MPRYVALGQMPKKRHIAFRKPGGGLYSEQVIGIHGFSGPMSVTYHINLPTRITSFEQKGSIGLARRCIDHHRHHGCVELALADVTGQLLDHGRAIDAIGRREDDHCGRLERFLQRCPSLRVEGIDTARLRMHAARQEQDRARQQAGKPKERRVQLALLPSYAIPRRPVGHGVRAAGGRCRRTRGPARAA